MGTVGGVADLGGGGWVCFNHKRLNLYGFKDSNNLSVIPLVF